MRGVRLLPILNRMSKYRVLINGQNLLLNLDGSPRKLGFYTTRFVDARNPEEAEDVAVELIREDAALKGNVLNGRDDPPMLYADEVEEIGVSDDDDSLGTGFSWYAEPEA